MYYAQAVTLVHFNDQGMDDWIDENNIGMIVIMMIEDDGSSWVSVFKRIYRKFPILFTRILLILANAESFKRCEEGAMMQFYDGLMVFESEIASCYAAVGLRLLTDPRTFLERFPISTLSLRGR